MNIYSYFSMLAFSLYIYLGIYVIRSNPREKVNQTFLFLSLAMAAWAFAYAFVYPAVNLANKDFVWFWYRVSALGWCTVPSIHLHFAMALTNRDQWFKKWWFRLLIYLPPLIFTYKAFTGILLVTDFMAVANTTVEIMNTNTSWYWANISWYAIYTTISFVLIALWGRKSNDLREKKQTRIILTTLVFSVITGMGINLVSPLMEVPLPAIAPIVTIVWAFGMWYAISKYQLMKLTVAIAAEEILANIVNLLVLINPEGKITKCNTQVHKVLGYSEERLKRRALSELLVNKESLEDILRKIADGSRSHLEQDILCKTIDGAEIPMRLSATAIKDEMGGLLGSVMIFQDLRETRQLQKEICERSKAEHALQESNSKLTSFAKILEDQNILLEQQNAELEAMSSSLAETNTSLAEKNIELSNILNNVGQGFTSFGSSLIINEGYSLECRRIFHKSPAGQKIARLLYPDDGQEILFLEKLLTQILTTEESDKTDIYLSLLPEEIQLYGRTIHLAYRLVGQQAPHQGSYMILILTDITDQRRLEAELEQEELIFKMLVKVIVNQDDFLKSIDDYRDFYATELNRLLCSEMSVHEMIGEIYRALHTFKGDFSLFDTVHTPEALHQAESLFMEINNNDTGVTLEELRGTLMQIDFPACLAEDVKIITTYLGEDFFHKKDVLTIEKSLLLRFENDIAKFLPDVQAQILLSDIRNLKKQSFRELLKQYPEYVEKLALRMDKPIHPMTIEGNDIAVDPDDYHAFAKSLGHVFRNAVDHGIESIDERILKGKDEIATISCNIETSDEEIVLSISDDGAGIDVGNLRIKAVQKGIYTEQEAMALSYNQLVPLIFNHEISLHDEISIISGRGLGLSAVKHEVDKMNGAIEVETAPDKGCTMIFHVPIR